MEIEVTEHNPLPYFNIVLRELSPFELTNLWRVLKKGRKTTSIMAEKEIALKIMLEIDKYSRRLEA